MVRVQETTFDGEELVYRPAKETLWTITWK
jgi:hypothetical protein